MMGLDLHLTVRGMPPIPRAVLAELELRLGGAPVLVRRVVTALALGALELEFDSDVASHGQLPIV